VKILQVHNRYRVSPSGENIVVDNEGSALSQRGHLVERFERLSEDIESWPAHKKALLPGQVVWSHSAFQALTRRLRDSRPDVVHVHNTVPLLSPSVLHACYKERVPVVATLHNYRLVCPAGTLFRDGAICHDCVGRAALPAIGRGCYGDSRAQTLPLAISTVVNRHAWRTRVSAYICISKSQRDIISPLGLPDDRVFVKWNMIPPIGRALTSEKRATVAFVGRLVDSKGVPVLMEAWDLYSSSSEHGALRLVIAGAGPLEASVAAWAQDRPDVDFVGLLSPTECRVLLETARAAVIPSQWEEPFGMVVVEAMAAGVAPIVSAHGSFPEMVVDSHDGTLFPPGDAKALAKAFHDVATRPERYEGFGRNARKAYEERFDPELNMRQLESIYEFAIDHPVWEDPNGRANVASSATAVPDLSKPRDVDQFSF
jgi:glycosyltransferase involved in cell wall biosynthesis